ncbi:MAG: trmE [Chloroflexi bacterium]|nr:trmE [Chloroflexota bacterium]
MALAWYLRGPRSYTGEDTVEISTHGNDALLELVVESARCRGARLAERGEFTRRAFVNGRLDLVQAEAVIDLVRAESRQGLSDAYGAMSGGLSARAGELRRSVVEALAHTEVRLEFVEEVATGCGDDLVGRIRRAEALATTLVESFEGARRRRGGWGVVLAGAPNAGKSTLFNALLGEDRSIVASEPGTTRDWVEGRVVWDGGIVRLMDTAGLRASASGVEMAGIERTHDLLRSADVVVHVIDGSGSCPAHTSVDIVHPRTILTLSKGDLPAHVVLPEALRVSAVSGEGLGELRRRILSLLPGRDAVDGEGLFRERHHDALRRAQMLCEEAREHAEAGNAELAAAALQEALRAVGDLLGEGVDGDVLDRIFSEFCIGK